MVAPIDENQAAVLEEALTRFHQAKIKGEQLDIEEFAEQYPQLQGQLQQRLYDLQEIDSLFDSLVHADGNDFEEVIRIQNLVGRKLANFEVEKIIGRGGMGVVYLARDTKLKRSVAIKALPSGILSDPAAQSRFRQEAEVLASLNHPNIAVIHEIIERDNGDTYLILEYVPGETLATRMANGPLPLQQALSISLQIAEAISVAHKNGVIHRDLKPGNIKFTQDNRVKVLDFGLAKTIRHEDISSRTTATDSGRIMGTPVYMSPEQARGHVTDHRTDIWSFGCILYEMLTGRLPFEGETSTDILARIIEREPDWKLLPDNTPESIRVLLRRCLEKDTSQRLISISEAAVEIRQALETRPVMSRRRKMIIGAIIIFVLCVLAIRLIPARKTQIAQEKIRLAVLPFENLGVSQDEYFADGISSEVTARLTGIHELAVIARQSTLKYKNRDKSIQQIATELGVDYILEGTVQREHRLDGTAQVRLIPQLVRISDNSQIWAQAYDSNTAGIFQIQSDLSEQVARALDITLLEPERKALASTPTENIEAYEYHLRGKMYEERGCWVEENARIAAQMYQKAVDLDPQFALAYAMLSDAHIKLYWHRHDRSDSRLAMAKKAVDTALRLAPDLPEGHLALGTYYYYVHLDYDSALEECAIALRSRPNDALIYALTGAIRRRQGKPELVPFPVTEFRA
jgi:serine/threonine protein kinase